MSSEKKKHLHVLIDAELYNMLITLAPQLSNQSKYRGAVSQIVEEALRLYFSQRLPPGGGGPSHAHTQSTKSARSSITQNKVLKAFMQIIDFIKRQRSYPEDEIICEITESELVRAIMEVKGVDPRTVKKYLEAFKEHRLIRYDRGTHPNIVYRVLIYPVCNTI